MQLSSSTDNAIAQDQSQANETVEIEKAMLLRMVWSLYELELEAFQSGEFDKMSQHRETAQDMMVWLLERV